MNMLKTTAAAVALMALPFAASAATSLASETVSLSPSDYSFSYTVGAGEDGVIFNFDIAEDLRIPTFSLSSTAPSGGVTTTLYQITDPSTGPSSFGLLNINTAGADVVPGTDYSAGDTFQVIFREGVNTPISYTVSFATEGETSPVPVPAAGLLLLSALGGAAAMRRRKKA